MNMKKKILIACVVTCLMIGASASGETNTYVILADQSKVVQTGGISGIHETHSIEGRFQLTVDFGAGVASFDWVNATLSESPFLYTRSLGMLFNMTELVGTVVNGTTIEFRGKRTNEPDVDILITVAIMGDRLRLTGEIVPPCCDRFNFDLDAVAQKETGGWVYRYFDDFSTDKAKDDSYSHSIFWPRDAFPPPEPYLFYYGSGDKRGLVFMDYQGQAAHLGYCFPIGPVPAAGGLRAVKGSLELDVHFPRNSDISQTPPGYLLYSLSGDGQTWSTPKRLGSGHHNIPIASLEGTCYVILLGTKALIDNLEVHLYSPPATIYVPQDFDTIQQAIDAAGDGDIIEVSPGVYTGKGNVDIDFLGKAIIVRSASGPEATIIDCMGSAGAGGAQRRGFYFHQGEDSKSVLQGFSIRSGRIPGSEIPPDSSRWNPNPAHPVGGGIYCELSSPTIINCVVRDCSAEVGGGIGCVGGAPAIIDCLIENCTAGGFGLAESGGCGGGIGLIRDCNAKISNCIVRDNSGYYNSYGGGIYCRLSSATITSSDISFNSARGNMNGGGVYCVGPVSRVVLQNCIISHNAADVGAGIFTERGVDVPDCSDSNCLPCNIRVTNCTIAHNRLSGPQMPPFPGGGIHSIGSDIIVKNSIAWYNEGTQIMLIDPASNSPVIYSNVEGGYPGTGNIDQVPLFAPTAIPDYHLQSLYGRYDPRTEKWVIDTNHSPSIDAGDPKDPVGQEPVPNGRRINMGAYGGTKQASKGVGGLVYHVDGINGINTNDGLSRSTALATIQKGVDSARDRDVVLVWPGVYKEEVNFGGKAITVASAADAAVVEAVTGYAFSFFTAEGRDSVLRNFVIRNSEYGIFCYGGASPTISNLTIVNNEFGIAAYGGADPDIANCILWNNANGDLFQCRVRYSCFERNGHNEGEGNISENPLFFDSNNDDYHLLSERGRYWPAHDVWVIDEVTSPCIDGGDPDVHPSRERLPNGGRLNMGAYGGTPYASMSEWQLKGDMNHDGTVNMKDFALLAENWLECTRWAPHVLPEADIIIPVEVPIIPAPRRQ